MNKLTWAYQTRRQHGVKIEEWNAKTLNLMLFPHEKTVDPKDDIYEYLIRRFVPDSIEILINNVKIFSDRLKDTEEMQSGALEYMQEYCERHRANRQPGSLKFQKIHSRMYTHHLSCSIVEQDPHYMALAEKNLIYNIEKCGEMFMPNYFVNKYYITDTGIVHESLNSMPAQYAANKNSSGFDLESAIKFCNADYQEYHQN